MDRDSLKRVCATLTSFRLPATHALVLLATEERAVSMQDLACASGSTTANATGLVDTMESKGLVERFHGEEDRRKVMVRISAEGTALLNQVMHQLQHA